MSIKLNGSTSGSVELDVPAAVSGGDIALTLPTSVGSAGQYLRNSSTAGTLEFANGGKIVQVVESSYATATSTTAVIPFDSTIPQNTEGTELLSASITPTSSANKLLINVSVPFIDLSGAIVSAIALFQDTAADAIALCTWTPPGGGYPNNVNFLHYMTAGTTSSTTFKVRYGANSGTVYINRSGGGTTFGGISAARIAIMEIAS